MSAPNERLMQAAAALTALTVARPLTDAQKAKLAAPLPRNEVKRLPGKDVDYVSGHYVIEHLNDVFGFDGWQDTYSTPVIREGKRPMVYVTCELTAAGVTRGDVGVGVAANDSPDSFETAIKAAYTDGLKRCARKLGDSFGLALYEKVSGGQQRAGVGLSTRALAMLDEIELLTTVEAVNGWAKANAAAVARLDADEQDIVKGAVAAARQQHRTAPPPHFEEPAAPAEPPTAAPAAKTSGPIGLREGIVAGHLTWVRSASSLDELVATYMRATLSVRDRTPAEQEELKAAMRVRAADLGASSELATALIDARKITTDPAHWDTFGVLLAMLRDARNAGDVAGVVRQHAAKAATLPDALKTKLNAARSERLKQLATPAPKPAVDEYAELVTLIGRATTEGELIGYHARLQLLGAQGKITEDEALAATEALNERAGALSEAA